MAQTRIKGLPVFTASLDGDGLGMVRVSLVDDPAVMVDFQTYANAKRMDYAVQDDEKRVVFGVLMRANFPIYRYDPSLGEFFITYKPEVIRQMAEKYMAEGRTGEFDLMHDGESINGVDCVQLFIKDTAKGINPAGFDDVEDGSLFGEFHVTNDAVWADIKAGTYKGFSIEIYNAIVPETGVISTEKVPAEVLAWLDEFYKNNMNFSNELKIRLARILGKFGNVTTDKAVLSWDGDGELVADTDVYIVGENGERIKPEDGEYKTEDGKVIIVVDGKVAEIKDDAAEVAPEPEAEQEPAEPVQAEGEEPAAEEPTPDPEPAPADDQAERIASLEQTVADLSAAVNELKDIVNGLVETLEGMNAKFSRPQAEPAHDTFKRDTTPAKVDDRFAHFSRMFSK